MEIRVLGPLEVRRDGHPVAIPGGRPAALLLRLLVARGQVVSTDALADALWGEATPRNIAGTIQVYVSHLRRALGASTIVTRSPGYALAGGLDIDHVRLEERLEEARALRSTGRFGEAAAVARSALDMVTGEPLADVADEEWARAEVVRLQGLVAAARWELHAAELDAGRHHEVIPFLAAAVAATPLDERLRALLMLALYRDGRQADALRCYSEGRSVLVDLLGVEPGEELRQLEARILQQDESLRSPAAGGPDGPSLQSEVASAPAGLIGRDDAAAALWKAWQEAREGRFRVVRVVGENGMGKSALVRWLVEQVAADGGAVGVGAALDADGVPPGWPWTAAIRHLVAGRPDAFAGHVVDLAGDAPPPGGPGNTRVAPSSRFDRFDAVVTMLAEAGLVEPVAVVLEDVQWADEATLELVGFLARASAPMHVLLVVTHRPVPVDHPVASLGAALAGLAASERIEVGPLTTAEVGRLVAMLAGTAADERVVAALASATGGNPFYVRELVPTLEVEGGIDVSRAAVPDTVSASLRRRADVLGSRALELLTAASLAPGEFDVEVLAALLDLDVDDATKLADAAVRDGLVVEGGSRLGSYRFAHDIVRHAFYDTLPPRQRAEGHLRLGRALAGGPRGASAPEIGYHFAQAIDVGGAEEAVLWLRRAAARSIRAGSHREALSSLRRALFVVRSRVRDEREECEVLLEVAASARLAADPDTARIARDRAVQLARALGDERLLVRAQEPLFGPAGLRLTAR